MNQYQQQQQRNPGAPQQPQMGYYQQQQYGHMQQQQMMGYGGGMVPMQNQQMMQGGMPKQQPQVGMMPGQHPQFARQQQPGMQQQMAAQQMMQMNPMQNVRVNQINQLLTFYRGSALTGRTQGGEDFRVPIQLTRSVQPLYVNVHIPFQFPQMVPAIKVQHRVVHPNIEASTMEYKGPVIAKWESHSNLLNVVRQMHNEFEMNPPIPEGHQILASQQARDSSSSMVSDAPKIEEHKGAESNSDHQEEEPEVVMRSEQERYQLAEKNVDDTISKSLEQSKEWVTTGLTSLSLTELQKLKEDPEYLDDTTLTSNQYVFLCKQKDQVEDQTLFLARENIQAAEDFEGDIQVYSETVHPNYEEQREKVNDLVESIEKKQRMFTRENAIKVLKTAANEKYKQGKSALQTFNKGGDMSKEDFLKQFIESRKQYYGLMAYAEVVQLAADVSQ